MLHKFLTLNKMMNKKNFKKRNFLKNLKKNLKLPIIIMIHLIKIMIVNQKRISKINQKIKK